MGGESRDGPQRPLGAQVKIWDFILRAKGKPRKVLNKGMM